MTGCRLLTPTGTALWAFYPCGDLPGPDCRVTTSPSLGADGTVFVAHRAMSQSTPTFWAIDGATGAAKWNFTGRGLNPGMGNFNGGGSAIGSDGNVYANNEDGYVYALRGDSGALLWRFGTEWPLHTAPSLGLGKRYARDARPFVSLAERCTYADRVE